MNNVGRVGFHRPPRLNPGIVWYGVSYCVFLESESVTPTGRVVVRDNAIVGTGPVCVRDNAGESRVRRGKLIVTKREERFFNFGVIRAELSKIVSSPS